MAGASWTKITSIWLLKPNSLSLHADSRREGSPHPSLEAGGPQSRGPRWKRRHAGAAACGHAAALCCPLPRASPSLHSQGGQDDRSAEGTRACTMERAERRVGPHGGPLFPGDSPGHPSPEYPGTHPPSDQLCRGSCHLLLSGRPGEASQLRGVRSVGQRDKNRALKLESKATLGVTLVCKLGHPGPPTW